MQCSPTGFATGEHLTLGPRFEVRLATLSGHSLALLDDLVGASEDRWRDL